MEKESIKPCSSASVRGEVALIYDKSAGILDLNDMKRGCEGTNSCFFTPPFSCAPCSRRFSRRLTGIITVSTGAAGTTGESKLIRLR
ncbi:MAG: hypothetical protein II774_09290, partial [Lachnospiraceae bacterium]|nr:hypothetical protein [Lachnospiraceae bacterium]